METQEPVKKTTVYVPRSLHERVQVAARKHLRSFNSELVWLLEQALAEVEGQEAKPDAPR
jgi:predicted HicB family RNase H-like nuclease